jgi:hypothetical protein
MWDHTGDNPYMYVNMKDGADDYMDEVEVKP